MLQFIQPSAGTIILPSNILPFHESFRYIWDAENLTERLAPEGGLAFIDNDNFVAVEIQGKKYAVSKLHYKRELKKAIDENGNEEWILLYSSHFVKGYSDSDDVLYFTNEKAAENSGYKFSIRLSQFRKKENIDFYGNEKTLRYHTSQGLSIDVKKRLPIFHSENDEYLVGLEVEKVDEEFRDIGLAWEIAENTGWIKENDGSLGSDGYELVSPILPLFNNEKLNNSIESVKEFINARTNDSCGGHINISRKGKSSEELLESLRNIAPILYSLYPTRLTNRYCEAKKWKNYFAYNSKYSAFYQKNNGVVEIRVFGRVKNVATLKWRLKLLQLLLPQSKERNLNQIAQQLGCTETPLYKHFIEQGYSHTDIGDKLRKINELSTVYATHRSGLSDSVKKRINATMGYDVF